MADIEGNGSADEGKWNRKQDEQRSSLGAERHDQKHINQSDGHGHDDGEVFAGAFQVFKHADPAHADVLGTLRLNFFVKHPLGFGYEAALIAADNVGANREAAAAAVAGDERLAVGDADVGDLRKLDRNSLRIRHRQALDRLRGREVLATEFADNVKAPLPFIE